MIINSNSNSCLVKVYIVVETDAGEGLLDELAVGRVEDHGVE